MDSVQDEIRLSYNLRDLPSAYHKAGLAGLLLLLHTMQQNSIEPRPTIEDITPDGYTLRLTEESLQAVFDELYDATVVEIEQHTKRTKTGGKPAPEPLRVVKTTEEDRKTGKKKTRTVYVYPQVVPRARFLESLGLQGKTAWVKLWRDTVWRTFRAIPKTRVAYEERAQGRRATGARVGGVWGELTKHLTSAARGKLHTVSVPGSLLVGAQDRNAERIGFLDSAATALLLHFWPVVMMPYVPQSIDKDGEEQFSDGYAIAIPEVADLLLFARRFPDLLAERSNQVIGYRPADALISIPEEGALDYLALLCQAAREHAQSAMADSVLGMDVMVLRKPGNSLMICSTKRITCNVDVLGDFVALRKTYRSPLFRAHLIRNLVAGRAWYAQFHDLVATMPANRFLWRSTEHSNKASAHLSKDARTKFNIVREDSLKGGR